jgi:hypothetical protein
MKHLKTSEGTILKLGKIFLRSSLITDRYNCTFSFLGGPFDTNSYSP